METPASVEPGSHAEAAGDAGEPAAGDAAASLRLASSLSTRTTMADATSTGGDQASISFTRA
jgi:hypothetical protein